jgi:putative Holliday junction resolvase
MGRVLGFDIGSSRLGVAVSDERRFVATPVAVLEVSVLKSDTRPLKRLQEEYEPDLCVIGLPLTLSGDEGPQARETRTLGDQLLKPLGLPLVYFDERLSSVEAKRALRQGGLTEKQVRGKVDMIAAALFLQTYLDNTRMDRS